MWVSNRVDDRQVQCVKGGKLQVNEVGWRDHGCKFITWMIDLRGKETMWAIIHCTGDHLVDVMEETVWCLEFEMMVKL